MGGKLRDQAKKRGGEKGKRVPNSQNVKNGSPKLDRAEGWGRTKGRDIEKRRGEPLKGPGNQ